MILNKHTKENQLSRGLDVCAWDFHPSCVRGEEEDDDWKHIWLRLDFMIDVCSFSFHPLSFVFEKPEKSHKKHEERKNKKKNIFSINRFMISSFMTFYYIDYIYE